MMKMTDASAVQGTSGSDRREAQPSDKLTPDYHAIGIVSEYFSSREVGHSRSLRVVPSFLRCAGLSTAGTPALPPHRGYAA